MYNNYEFQYCGGKCSWCKKKGGGTYKIMNYCKYQDKIICTDCLFDPKRRRFFSNYFSNYKTGKPKAPPLIRAIL